MVQLHSLRLSTAILYITFVAVAFSSKPTFALSPVPITGEEVEIAGYCGELFKHAVTTNEEEKDIWVRVMAAAIIKQGEHLDYIERAAKQAHVLLSSAEEEMAALENDIELDELQDDIKAAFEIEALQCYDKLSSFIGFMWPLCGEPLTSLLSPEQEGEQPKPHNSLEVDALIEDLKLTTEARMVDKMPNLISCLTIPLPPEFNRSHWPLSRLLVLKHSVSEALK